MATIITAGNLTRLAGELMKAGCRVIAPAKLDGMVVFKAITDEHEMLPEGEYILPHSSFKEFVFPRTECILRYRLGEQGKVSYEATNLDAEPAQAAIGCRPCDAASLPILDKVFGWDYRDEFYFKRREKLTVVSIACSRAGERCYCTSVGCAPDSKAGSDILLKKTAGDKYVVEALSDKGRQLAEKHASLFEKAEGEPPVEVVDLKPAFDVEKIKPWLDTHFEDPLWLDMAARCMGCGTCAYGCPTCHCFDIVDEGDLRGGCRLKNWDTCAAVLFTKHGSGHNPRTSQEQRYRQRVMHKFKYYLEKFGLRACVGCGRCSNRCPVGQDLYAVLKTIAERAAK
ncbi:MAG: 4Fe-4S dicluster domain-containing protein [Planctomycetota bacterium]|nr:4Fe-4S dicluster domain-containing protein [Planctomycetota bacterium]